MLRNRVFNLLIAIALVIVTAFTAREAVATTILSSEGNKARVCASLPSLYSLRTEYMKETNVWVVRTENGPTGTDGGLINLLSDYRSCSR